MNGRFYRKFAWTGINRNRQLYIPYLIAAIAMVTAFYIFGFLTASDVVKSLPGHQVLYYMFLCGEWAIALFSVPFLFYTNASLIKRRKKELGLYNILGMNKKNIVQILFWETAINYGIAVIGGLFFGVTFSKMAELGLVNIMDRTPNYRIYVEWKAVLTAIGVYAAIFCLLLFNMIRQIHQNNPIELLHSESAGERPPKIRVFPAILSLVLIAAGYVIAIKLKPPLEKGTDKMLLAAALISLGTFLFFICASVFLCKILQNNKKYYYQTSHFISVSTMSYRMKRNGSSLASICILSTAVLVTFSFAASFYGGAIDAIKKEYPYDMGVHLDIAAEDMKEEFAFQSVTDEYRSKIEEIVRDAGVPVTENRETYSANMLGLLTDGHLDLRSDLRETWFTPGYYTGWEKGNQQIIQLRIIDLETYNKLCGTNEQLRKNEVLFAARNLKYQKKEIVLYDGTKVRVQKRVEQVPNLSETRVTDASLAVSHGIEEVFLIVPDLYSFMGEEEGSSRYTEANYLKYSWEKGVNVPKDAAGLEKAYSEVRKQTRSIAKTTGKPKLSCYLQTQKTEKFYGLAGGLLFLVIIINILFVFITGMIMYYKQISEGFEDQKRFAIMRKIGMTKKEIKRSIRSQMLTVFSLPLITAGIHLAFTSNVPYLLMKMAVVDNKELLAKMMCAAYLCFAAAYALVYMLTSRMYFKIVNRSADE